MWLEIWGEVICRLACLLVDTVPYITTMEGSKPAKVQSLEPKPQQHQPIYLLCDLMQVAQSLCHSVSASTMSESQRVVMIKWAIFIEDASPTNVVSMCMMGVHVGIEHRSLFS